jgi:hypothetical protein
VANGFLTHSDSKTSTSLKYNENYFCKAPKWVLKVFLLASVSLLGHLSK